ncbi:MAG: hypothetical protein R3E86_15025 [Pseudomonadales bacterium]
MSAPAEAEAIDRIGSGTRVRTPRAHQAALLDQAVSAVRSHLDPTVALLRCPRGSGFWLVLESLAFALLLLHRARSAGADDGDVGLAGRIVDAVLQAQNRKLLSPDHGTFPVLWTPERRQRSVPDPDSREILGTLLAVLIEDHLDAMGPARTAQLREAVRRTVRPAQTPAGDGTAMRMLSAWLDLHYGDRFRGERMVTEISSMEPATLTEGRVGNPRAYALELWAISLWQRSPRLSAQADALVGDVLGEAVRDVHPQMPELFGAATTCAAAREDQFPWLGAWLTWHALGPVPMLPKSLGDPLLATLYALPAAAGLQVPVATTARRPAGSELALTHRLGSHELSGWCEQSLLIEARESPVTRLAHTPVVGARWQTSAGHNAWLRCLTSDAQRARCRKRFVHLDRPGRVTVEVFNLGPSGARMIEHGWWLSGLHFATDGLQLVQAERTERCLSLTLRPSGTDPLLMFSPLP